MKRFARLAAATVTILTLIEPAAAPAATAGIAYDSVQKFAMGGDAGTQAEPGGFASDFATASTPIVKTGKRGFLGLNAMAEAGSAAMSAFKNGSAERHYVAGAKYRVDTIASGEARIVDCTARTLTTLDLNKKTYKIVSLDTPESGDTSSPRTRGRGAPGPTPTDDGTKVAIAMTTRVLGPKAIDGVATTGYDAHMKMTTTRPTGESQSFDTTMTSYLSSYAEPSESCPEVASRLTARGDGANAPGMAQMALMMMALRTPKGDARFSVSNSGPAMPSEKLALWQHTMMGQGNGLAILVERGNVRSIRENDAVFSIPADFTKSS